MKEWLRKQSLIKVLALVAICLIPVVYKELLDEFSLGRVISSALYVLPLCFLLASIRKKWIFIVFSSVLMVTSFLETMMVLLYKNYLTQVSQVVYVRAEGPKAHRSSTP